MVRSCFHMGCTSGYNSGKYGSGSSHLFQFPKGGSEELRRIWNQNIPKQVGKQFDFGKDTLCHLHFEEEYIVDKHFIFYNGVKVSQGPRKRWKLEPDAVPTKFSNLKVSKLYDRRNLKRKPPASRVSGPTTKKKMIFDNNEQERLQTDPKTSPTLSTTYPLALIQEGSEVLLPQNGKIQIQVHEDGLLATIFEIGVFNLNYFIEMKRCIQIFQNGITTGITTTLDGRRMSKYDNYAIKNVENIRDLVLQVSHLAVCEGVSNYANIENCKTGIKRGQVWYSNGCKVEINDNQRKCDKCQSFRNTLQKIQGRLKNKCSVKRRLKVTPALPAKARAYVKALRVRMTNKTQQLRRCQAKSALLRLSMTLLKKQMKQAETTSMLECIKKSNLPDNMKESMRNAIQNAKRRSSKENRYESGWLLQCMLLKIKSPQAYRHLRANQILLLPHPSTLQRMISGMPCEFGFIDFIFDQLRKTFSEKPRKEGEGMVMFDEIKVREELSYDKIKMEFNGFMDYGGETTQTDKIDASSKMADHALVFMYKSHYSKIMQPLGSFATKGAASGDTLAKLLISCVVRLEAANARISSVVCDGATTNKSMWKILGVHGGLAKFSSKIEHPCQGGSTDRKRHLYFFSDVPHLIKCIRNHFFKHQLVWFNGRSINSSYYTAVYDLEQKLSPGLRLIPRITEAHLKPNAFQKMRVYLATQIFSKSMAGGIQFYRNRDEAFLRGSEATEDFTRLMNELFDALNACHTSVGVKPNSKTYKVSEAFKNQLFDSEIIQTFASDVTIEGLRVTLQSFLDIINYFVREAGFEYVLTGKINQDSLERFFGILRQSAGDDDHPTIISFMHLYRILCIYSPTAKLLNGNVNKGDDAPVVMSNYVDVLLKKSKLETARARAKRQNIDDKIFDSIISGQSGISHESHHLLDHDYCKPLANDCVVYQLCGYVAHRVKTGNEFTTCQQCKESVSSFDESFTMEAVLTKIESLGSLQYPSLGLFNLINNHVEPKISENLAGMHADLVSRIVDSFSNLPSAGIGCGEDGHNEYLVVRIVSFYLSVRMYFFARQFNSNIVTSRIKTKQQRKLAKLN